MDAAVLPHPLEDLQPALCLPGTDHTPNTPISRWSGEAICWSSSELPFIVSYNEVRLARVRG